MPRALTIFFLLLTSCAIAGVYGAIHNQISYTVSPEYFHNFKFAQFHIAPGLQNRVGAAIVGWLASWWMGLTIAVPITCIAAFIPDDRAFVRCFLSATALVVMVTLLTGLAALAYSYATYAPNNLPDWITDFHVADRVAFARAGNMHNFSYVGGGIGLIAAAIYLPVANYRICKRLGGRKNWIGSVILAVLSPLVALIALQLSSLLAMLV